MVSLPRPPALGALALVLALGLTGCGGDDDRAAAPAPSPTPTEVASPTPTAQPSFDPASPAIPAPGLPTGFPKDDVPLLPGVVTQPLGEGSTEVGKRGWVLEINTDQEFEPCFEAAQAALLARGYVKQPGEIKDASNWQAQFVGDDWIVIVSTSPADGGGCRLGYSVGEPGPGGPR